MTKRNVAIYPGTFDPLTNGHVDLIQRALGMFDRVVVALAQNIRKTPMFSVDERREMLAKTFPGEDRLEVDAFEGLLVNYARDRGANVIVRGLRATADFEYEFQLAHMNRQLAPDVETIFLMTAPDAFYVSSSLVKEVAGMGGDISKNVPPAVREAFERRKGLPQRG